MTIVLFSVARLVTIRVALVWMLGVCIGVLDSIGISWIIVWWFSIWMSVFICIILGMYLKRLVNTFLVRILILSVMESKVMSSGL